MKVYINSKMTGNARKEQLNGRDHTVIEMVSIVGDSVMNNGLYPDEEVTNTYSQLNCLPAPDGHPKIQGKPVSAFHPVATNAHNIGAFIRNPKKEGKVVTNELWIDNEVANNTVNGKLLLEKIEANDKDDLIGVSTGLTLDQEVANGTNEDDGKDFTWVGRNFKFDHVAVLLNERAAGEHVGTKLTINEGEENEEELTVVSLNELTARSLEDKLRDALKEDVISSHNWVWVMDIFLESKQVVYEVSSDDEGSTLFKRGYAIDGNDNIILLDDVKEVERQTTFIEVDSNGAATNSENDPMAKHGKAKSGGDNKAATKEEDDKKASELNVENAMELLESKGMVINTKDESDDLEFYKKNQPKINALLKKEEAKLGDMRTKIVANSELTDDDVAGMDEDRLERISNSLVYKQDHSLQNGGGSVQTNSKEFLADYSADAVENDMKSKENDNG